MGCDQRSVPDHCPVGIARRRMVRYLVGLLGELGSGGISPREIIGRHWRSVSREGVGDMSHGICMCCDFVCDTWMDMADKCGVGIVQVIE